MGTIVFRRAQLLILLIGLLAVSFAGAGERVVAVGDIHGSIDGIVEILGRAGLIDDGAHWIGGETTLVQTGDMFDRGLEVRKVLDLLMRLQVEAEAAGGRVEVLLGNHEGMNLLGIYRDINPEIFGTFVDDRSAKRRKAGYKAFQKYWIARARAAGAGAPHFGAEVKELWMGEHPPGWLEYNQALSPDGRYGSWLRERPVAVLIGEVVFVHGGLGPALAGLSVDDINRRVREEMRSFDEARKYMIDNHIVHPTAGRDAMLVAYRQLETPDPALDLLANVSSWYLLSADGPLWFRGAARWDEATQGAAMAEILAGVGAKRMVVGHTPRKDGRIQVRFSGRVFLIDTGMLSSHYKDGRPSALEISEGVFTALYPDGSVLLEAEIEAMPEAAQLLPGASIPSGTGEPLPESASR